MPFCTTLSLFSPFFHPPRAYDAFQAWFGADNPDDDAQNPIDPGIRRTVYCSAISVTSNDNFWDWLFERYQVS